MGGGASHIPKALVSTYREDESNVSSLNGLKHRSYSSEFNFSERDEIKIVQELLGKEDDLPCEHLDPTLSDDDLRALQSITVPIPLNEGKRLKILRQSNLLDSDIMDPEFDRFTSLAHRILEVYIQSILYIIPHIGYSLLYTCDKTGAMCSS